jgi:hypothetical protein
MEHECIAHAEIRSYVGPVETFNWFWLHLDKYTVQP